MRLTVSLLVLAACAAAPAAASAADVATDVPCYLAPNEMLRTPGQEVTLTGTGWTPGAPWTVSGGLDATGTVDANGGVAASATAPAIGATRRTPKTLTLSATDGTQTATTTMRVVNGGAIWSDDGAPRDKVRWSFGGLPPTQPIYVHVRRGSKTLKTTRVGIAKGTCGTASKRLRRLPIAPGSVRDGLYTIAVDSRKRYQPGGSYEYRYRVSTKPRR